MVQPQRIIVRAPNWLGDHVMAFSFYEQLRRGFPKARLVCLLPEGLQGLISNGLFDEEWAFKKSDFKNKNKVFNWIQKIQEQKFDLSYSLTASWSSALLFYRAKILRRYGFSESGSGILLSQFIPWRGTESKLHKSDLFLELLKMGSQESEKSDAAKRSTSPSLRVQESYWVIAPGAALPLREWPYFPELLFEIKKKYPNQKIVVVGTSLEEAWISRLKRWKLKGVEDLIQKTSLLQLRDLCSKAQLVIANDSGVAHVAGTLAQAPTLVLFGPGTPDYIAPRGPSVHSLTPSSKVGCAPCEKAYCRSPWGYQKCLKEISVDTVLTKVEKILSL